MFNIGAIELLIIIFSLLIFIKPEDIPKIAKNIGLFYRRLSKHILNLKYELNNLKTIDRPTKKRKKKQMSYLDHLRELRNRLLLCFAFLFTNFLVCLYFSDIIAKILINPLFQITENDGKRMIFTSLPEIFISNLKISLFASFLCSFPIFIMQFFFFVSPALYKKEKNFFSPILFLIPI